MTHKHENTAHSKTNLSSSQSMFLLITALMKGQYSKKIINFVFVFVGS